MKCNQAGIDLIKSFESCDLDAYLDEHVPPKPTIGWGHTGPEVHMGLTWTQQQADDQLLDDLAHRAEQPVNYLVKHPLTDNQFAALCALVFNIGAGNFGTSTLLRDINSGNSADEGVQWARWNHCGGAVVSGLTRRRTAEWKLWGTPDAETDS